MYRLRRRRGLALGAVFFCLVLYLATSFVWFVRVTGVNRLSQGEILKLAEELDLRPGVWKRRLNLPELEEEMVRRHRGIAWAGLRVKGIVLEIEIVEHIPPVEQDPAPADLVAAKDGLIQRVVVVEGEAVVSAGDTVSQGDLLIRGEKPLAFPEEGEEPPLKEKVRARGRYGPGSGMNPGCPWKRRSAGWCPARRAGRASSWSGRGAASASGVPRRILIPIPGRSCASGPGNGGI